MESHQAWGARIGGETIATVFAVLRLARGLARAPVHCYGHRVARTEEGAIVPGAPQDDAEVSLIKALAKGDQQALASLYDQFSPILLAVAQRILGNAKEAEDLLHDVFLEVWRHASDYDHSRGTVRAWLLMRMRSRALDRKRAQGRSKVVLLENGQMPDGEAREEDPSLAPDRAVVRRAVAELPPDQRVVLELGYFEGLTSAEIAARIEIPIGTVKSRVARGLATLRSGIVGEEGGRKK